MDHSRAPVLDALCEYRDQGIARKRIGLLYPAPDAGEDDFPDLAVPLRGRPGCWACPPC
ncbi:hypothetical protein [Amycolatopsis sp. NPDC058986]|uniref:hypothetical protein n=1 Tax=unclassified Amycolatopsis TaxID=2618356 RepID=UPI00367105F2